MAKLCAKGKAAAKRKFKVYPSAYANMYGSAVCSGKVTPGGKKKRNLKYYPLPAGKYLTVQLVGDKLAISSKDIKKLDGVKDLLVSRGNYFLEERYKISPNGEKIFTYLFLTKNI